MTLTHRENMINTRENPLPPWEMDDLIVEVLATGVPAKEICKTMCISPARVSMAARSAKYVKDNNLVLDGTPPTLEVVKAAIAAMPTHLAARTLRITHAELRAYFE